MMLKRVVWQWRMVVELLVAVVRWWKMAVCGSKTVVLVWEMMVGLLVFAVFGVYFDGWRLWFLRFGGWKWRFAWCNIRNVRWLSGGKCYGMAESMLSKQGFINLNIRFFELESSFLDIVSRVFELGSEGLVWFSGGFYLRKRWLGFLNGKGAGGERVLVGGFWAELFCFSVVGWGRRLSVWGLMGGNVILFGVFLAFFFGVSDGMLYL